MLHENLFVIRLLFIIFILSHNFVMQIVNGTSSLIEPRHQKTHLFLGLVLHLDDLEHVLYVFDLLGRLSAL